MPARRPENGTGEALFRTKSWSKRRIGLAKSSEAFMTNGATHMVPRIVLAGVVATAALASFHFNPARAADECLTKPKGPAPQGQHWYYHNERGSKRQCWYLGDEGSRGASVGVGKSAAALAHQHHPLSQTEADAHAEFGSPAAPASDSKRAVVGAVATTPVEPSPMAAAATSGVAAAPATLASADGGTATLAQDSGAATLAQDNVAVAADQSSVASRWPDPTEAAQPITMPPPNPATVQVAAAESAPAASVDASTAVAADSSATDSGSPSVTGLASTIDSSRARLFAFLGAVALAGFSISVLVARARARRRIRLEPALARRRPRWPADAEIDQMQLPEADRYPSLATGSEPGSRRAAGLSFIPREDARYDEQYEVEDLLARYGGQARGNR
jgi:hypothetical protein